MVHFENNMSADYADFLIKYMKICAIRGLVIETVLIEICSNILSTKHRQPLMEALNVTDHVKK